LVGIKGYRVKKVILFLILFVALFAKININTASIKELTTLKGIGITKAKAIIKYRKKHKFKKVEEIMNVKGIGKKTFEKIKNEISFGDE